MNYKNVTAWIFATLMLVIVLLFIYPSSFVIWLAVMGLPALIIVQAIVVLRAKDESRHTFNDDKWYEDR